MFKYSSLVFILVFGLVACVHNPRFQGEPCKTVCGVRLYGFNDCQGFQAAENRAVKLYGEHIKSVCDRLYGWVVYIQPAENLTTEGGWFSPKNKMMVGGLTWCWQQTMQIGTDDWSSSSLAHELLHAMECTDRIGDEDPHDGWEKSWRFDEIKKAR